MSALVLPARRDARTTPGMVIFVTLSFLGSWFVAATLRVFALDGKAGPLDTRSFTTSLLYALTMGWQPLVATWMVRRWVDPSVRVDLGLRPCRRVFSVVGILGPLALTALATAVAWAVASDAASADTLGGPPEGEIRAGAASLGRIVPVSLAFVGTLALGWAQAFAEELGWRGYFLPRAMSRFGRWRGLVVHGAVWGLWYAPVLFFSIGPGLAPLAVGLHSLGAVVTCMLLGMLLGWLRLASRSLVPVVVANATLTFAVGLPYVVGGIDVGLRSAILGPIGWAFLVASIAVLVAARWRPVVQVPEPGAWVRLRCSVRPPACWRRWSCFQRRCGGWIAICRKGTRSTLSIRPPRGSPG